MTEVTEETYNDVLEDLKLDYIRQAGEELRVRLFPQPKRMHQPDGETVEGPTPYPLPVGLSYQPGNGTAYSLIFTRLHTIRQLGPIVNPDGGGWSVPTGNFGGNGTPHEPGYVLVVKCNEASSDYSFVVDLGMERPYLHPSYIGEKIRSNLADATAITALLRAVAGQELADKS